MSNFDYQHFFPYKTIREQQKVAIDFCLDSFLNHKKRFIVLELGTGCGKSAIGVTVARYLNSVLSENENIIPGAYTITTQKILQRQYIEDFGHPHGKMCSIESSTNYDCSFYKNSTCSESLQLLKGEKKGSPFWNNCIMHCRYRGAKSRFLSSQESITNFSYFLSETMYGGQINPRSLLIVDEAHNCESELSKFTEITISEKFAKDVLKLEWPNAKSENPAFKWIKNVYKPKLVAHLTHVNTMLSKLKGLKDNLQEFASIAKQYDMLDKHTCKINRFISMFDEENWILNLIEADGRSMRKFEFKPVNISPYSHEMLFKFGQYVLLMSATIVNHDVFCDSMGINKSDVSFLSIDSPFPIENRPIIYVPAGSMSKENIDTTLPNMVEMVKAILDEHKGQKGIIHTHTFKVANFLKQNIKGRRLIIHDSLNREEMIEKHMSSDKDTVLISPSLSEGIDLKNDLSRFQIICKIPFPYLGDKIVKKRSGKNKKWYPYQTAKSIIQSVGRSIRNENDYAATYILDSSWEIFFNKNKDMFPESFQKCIQK